MTPTAYLGLGTNLGDLTANLDFARRELGAGGAAILAASREEMTAPVGGVVQPDFRNQVVAVDTRLGPLALLALAKRIELRAGRRPGATPRWGPRPLDIDILLYGDLVLQSPELTIPHAELTRRAYVISELLELDPVLKDPLGGEPLARVLESLG